MSQQGWISLVSGRWFSSRSRLAGASSPWLASFGIAAGVATLVVVMAVMNGFQTGYMQALLEVSSFHARITLPIDVVPPAAALDRLRSMPGVRSVLPFREITALLAAENGRNLPVRLLLLPQGFEKLDPGFARELGVGSASLAENSICIGSELGRQLGLGESERANIVLPTGNEDDGIGIRELSLTVGSTFKSGYYQFDSALALAPESLFFGAEGRPVGELVLGVKLRHQDRDADFAASLPALAGFLPASGYRVESWREYNRSFFGALRTEKVMMLLLIGLVFLVVAVNIHHAMRRIVAMRGEDIAVLRALGARTEDLRGIFVRNGLVTGTRGAAVGLAIGLAIVFNINAVISSASTVAAFVGGLFSGLGGGEGAGTVGSVFYLQSVPVAVFWPETIGIAAVALASAVIASMSASHESARRLPSEILRNE